MNTLPESRRVRQETVGRDESFSLRYRAKQCKIAIRIQRERRRASITILQRKEPIQSSTVTRYVTICWEAAITLTNPLGPVDDDFESWVRPHVQMMRAVAWRLSPRGMGEDVVQEAMLRAWRHLSRFDPDKGSPRSWLAAITANEAGHARRKFRPDHELVDAEAPTPSPTSGDVNEALAALNNKQRLAVDLYYFVGLPIRETAQVMKCPEGSVKSTLFAARGRIHAQLEEMSRNG